MVLTDEQQTDMYPAATMEVATIANESIYYGNLTNTQLNRPSFFSDPLYPNSGNTKVARIKNATGIQKLGPNMILKVMAGDSYNLRVASGWSSASSATNSSTNVLTDLLNLLSTGAAGVSGGKATPAQLQATNSGLNAGLTSFMGTQTTSGTKPKAYINWILLDEQFKVVQGESGFQQVGASGTTTIHTRTNIPINKSGYLYVFTSNEATNIDVYFDNLQVTHVRGALLETSEYYPHGLVMRNISYKSFGKPENKKQKYNGYELNTDFDLNLYESFYRSHDPQIGRFWQLDPKPNEFESLYAAMGNNPILNFDMLGDTVYNANADDDALIQQWIAQGLNLKKGQANPFSFNKDGILGMNKAAYNKLSKAQKGIADNVVQAINAKEFLEIELVAAETVIETEVLKLKENETLIKIVGYEKDGKTPIFKEYNNGDVYVKRIGDYGGGYVDEPVVNGNGPGSNSVLSRILRSANKGTVQGTNGVQVANPNYSILFHEIFGHFIYHTINNSCTQNQETINYENKVRALRGLPLRSGKDHPADKDY